VRICVGGEIDCRNCGPFSGASEGWSAIFSGP
jgi:hypothetical protein